MGKHSEKKCKKHFRCKRTCKPKCRCEKCKYEVKVKCQTPAADVDQGIWNATLVAPAGSAFHPSPKNSGSYTVVNGIVTAVAAFSIVGPGRPYPTDFSGTLLTLPVPAVNDANFRGTLIYYVTLPGGGWKAITTTLLNFHERTLAVVPGTSVNIYTQLTSPNPVLPTWQVWIFITYTRG